MEKLFKSEAPPSASFLRRFDLLQFLIGKLFKTRTIMSGNQVLYLYYDLSLSIWRVSSDPLM